MPFEPYTEVVITTDGEKIKVRQGYDAENAPPVDDEPAIRTVLIPKESAGIPEKLPDKPGAAGNAPAPNIREVHLPPDEHGSPRDGRKDRAPPEKPLPARTPARSERPEPTAAPRGEPEPAVQPPPARRPRGKTEPKPSGREGKPGRPHQPQRQHRRDFVVSYQGHFIGHYRSARRISNRKAFEKVAALLQSSIDDFDIRELEIYKPVLLAVERPDSIDEISDGSFEWFSRGADAT